jgi:hypothetical protein
LRVRAARDLDPPVAMLVAGAAVSVAGLVFLLIAKLLRRA